MTQSQKDLDSFKAHNNQYLIEEVNNPPSVLEEYKQFDNENRFANNGFERAITMTKELPKIHMDIGSGLGWVVRKTAPFFEKVYAVEPSARATELAAEALKDQKNITFLNKDMIDALDEVGTSQPLFITTSVVLSHITDTYVAEFLAHLTSLPNGSVVFFDERYGKNIQWYLWYIRNKNWWAMNLPDWQLSFFDIQNSGYNSGIYGIKVGRENITNQYRLSPFSRIWWEIQGLWYRVLSLFRKIMKKGISRKSVV